MSFAHFFFFSTPCPGEGKHLHRICFHFRGRSPVCCPPRGFIISLAWCPCLINSSLTSAITTSPVACQFCAGRVYVFLGHQVSPGLEKCLAHHKESRNLFLELTHSVPWAGAGTRPVLGWPLTCTISPRYNLSRLSRQWMEMQTGRWGDKGRRSHPMVSEARDPTKKKENTLWKPADGEEKRGWGSPGQQ